METMANIIENINITETSEYQLKQLKFFRVDIKDNINDSKINEILKFI